MQQISGELRQGNMLNAQDSHILRNTWLVAERIRGPDQAQIQATCAAVHPDVAKDKAAAHQIFIEINDAYQALTDAPRRRAYDSILDMDSNGQVETRDPGAGSPTQLEVNAGQVSQKRGGAAPQGRSSGLFSKRGSSRPPATARRLCGPTLGMRRLMPCWEIFTARRDASRRL